MLANKEPTREQVIAWAREVELFATTSVLIKFAALVAAAEREACAKVCDSVNNYDNPMTATDCADAIRARGQG